MRSQAAFMAMTLCPLSRGERELELPRLARHGNIL